jgi:beta-lactam-binding protein with PASTA domain
MLSQKNYNLLLYSLIFTILFFTTSILTYRTVLKGEMVTIPDLIGKTFEVAKSELSRKRLSIAQTGIQFDTRYERGIVIFHEPSEGSKIKINNVVKVIISAGKEKVIVPKIKGETFQNIRPILVESGVVRGTISHVHDSRYPAGRIIAQYPPSQDEVGRGSAVSLLISEGEWEEKYLMPDLIGRKAEDVIPWLEELSFKVEDVRNTYYPGLSSGIIIKQHPQQGYMIQKNYPITLEVSK